MIKDIGFDYDGTLTDELNFTVSEFLEFHRKEKGVPYKGRIKTNVISCKERFPDCDSDFLQLFEKWHWVHYRRECKFRPYVKELFLKLKQMGLRIHIVSARVPLEDETIEELEDVTRSRFEEEGIPVDEIHLGLSEKASVCVGNGIELLVEDDPKFFIKTSEKIPVFIMHNPYNVNFRGKNLWRIYDLNPAPFIENLKYAVSHLDNWEPEYVFEDSDRDRKPVIEESKKEDCAPLEFDISAEGTVCFNPPALREENIIFVVPFRRAREKDSFTDLLKKKFDGSVEVIRLQLLERDLETVILTEEDDLISSIIKQKNPKGVDLTDINSTAGYRVKCEIIQTLLKYAASHPKKKFIFDGELIMMLSRDLLEPYANHPIFIPGATEKDHKTIIRSKYKKGYNPWIVMEDLTEVATQIRKWKIIAGTAKKQLPSFINRQTTDSDGVDIVRLLPEESPHSPDVLDAILSSRTYLLADLHLSTKDTEKTKRIVQAINRRVGTKDHLLFLGDFDGKKGTGSFQLVKSFLKSLHCKNIYLILGNNDPYTIEEYMKLGFLTVTDKAEWQESPQRKVILTHCPYPVEREEVNIHGHIHGSRTYWNMDWQNHYDIWDEDFNPITIQECLNILDRGEYTAKSENHNVYK